MCTLHRIWEDAMGEACSEQGGDEKREQNFSCKAWEEETTRKT
jgi:hypothetical protein